MKQPTILDENLFMKIDMEQKEYFTHIFEQSLNKAKRR